MMRIITGSARGIPLETLPGDETRPTSERAKEAIFSALQFEIEGSRVLDLFSGSGQLGLEALSRGALHATLCDRSKSAVGIIRENAMRTKLDGKCDILQMDALTFVGQKNKNAPYQFIFLDPPYALGLIPTLLKRLLENGYANENTVLICESASRADVFSGDTELEKLFTVRKEYHYGIAQITMLVPKGGE